MNLLERATRRNGATILKHLRRQRGLTQTQLGRRTGVSRARISTLETERSELTVTEWRTLCRDFNLSLGLICLNPRQLLASLRRAG